MLSLARMFVVYIPMAMIGSAMFGYVGVFGATAIANVVVGIAALIWNRRVLATERQMVLADQEVSGRTPNR